MIKLSLLIFSLLITTSCEQNPASTDGSVATDSHKNTEETNNIINANIINNYGTGAPCGGSVLIHDSKVMRSVDGGLARMNDATLDLEDVTIGNFNQSQVYHIEKIGDNFWFGITDFIDLNEVHVLDADGNSIATYNVGLMPGDFAHWTGTDENNEALSWVFVANEGAYGSSNGSISMINEDGDVFETDAIGDVVQSLEVYENKLIVLVNNSHLIKIYNITSDGLAMPGIEVSTEASGPREMVIVDEDVYFTNRNTSDVKIFNLTTYNIDASIPVGDYPEGITTDGSTIWVANSGGTTVNEIDISSRTVTTTYEVGNGPQNLVFHNNEIYISRTFYSADWTETYHGASKIIK